MPEHRKRPGDPTAVSRGRRGGLKGGKARSKKLGNPRRSRRDSNPSTNTSDVWLYAHGIESNEEPNNSGGKWMIFVAPNRVDEYWRNIKKAVEAGNLWHAKVSTLKNFQMNFRRPNHVICVYTKEWRDRKDVFRQREVLRRLGFTSKLYYKSDEMTLAGQTGSIYSV